MEMPLPKTNEAACICMDIPEKATANVVKDSEKTPEKFAELNTLAALPTSKKETKIEYKTSLFITLSRAPTIMEKTVTNPHIITVFCAAFFTEAGKLNLKFSRSFVVFEVLFPNPKNQPVKIEDSNTDIYTITPSLILPRIKPPIPPIANDGLMLFEMPINLSHSDFDMLPLLYSITAHFIPIGAPQTFPHINAVIPEPLILKM